jgi:hypothetical protein
VLGDTLKVVAVDRVAEFFWQPEARVCFFSVFLACSHGRPARSVPAKPFAEPELKWVMSETTGLC